MLCLRSGEFLKILLAETGERTEIFRRVFDTEVFNRITMQLYDKQKEAKEELQGLKIEFATISSNVDLEEKIEAKDINELVIYQILEELKQKVDKNKEEFSHLEKETKILEKEFQKQEVVFQKKWNTKMEVEKLQKESNALEEKFQILLEEEQKSKQDSQHLKSMYENWKRYEIFDKKNQDLKNRMQKLVEILKDQAEHEKQSKEYLIKEKEYQSANADYLQKEDEFFREQAGILAVKLEEGKPCPVCGSKEHPKPASKSKSVLSKEELDDYKNTLENKQKSIALLKEKLAAIHSKIDTLLKELAITEDAEKEKKQLEIEIDTNQSQGDEISQSLQESYFAITGKKMDFSHFALDSFQEEVQQKISEVKETITKIKTLKEEKSKEIKTKSKSIEKIDFDKIEEEQRQKRKELEEKQKMTSEFHRHLENHKTALEKLEKLAEKLIRIMKEYSILDELYRTASRNFTSEKPELTLNSIYKSIILIWLFKKLIKGL